MWLNASNHKSWQHRCAGKVLDRPQQWMSTEGARAITECSAVILPVLFNSSGVGPESVTSGCLGQYYRQGGPGLELSESSTPASSVSLQGSTTTPRVAQSTLEEQGWDCVRGAWGGSCSDLVEHTTTLWTHLGVGLCVCVCVCGRGGDRERQITERVGETREREGPDSTAIPMFMN